MVDVSAKPPTARRAVAEAEVAVSAETMSLVIDGGGAKGDVLTVAELAGVMGGKQTAELIPLCHPLPLTDLVVAITPDRAAGVLRIRAEAATTAPTGVEMEAMTAASVAALTVYDMVKGVERGVEVRGDPAALEDRRQERGVAPAVAGRCARPIETEARRPDRRPDRQATGRRMTDAGRARPTSALVLTVSDRSAAGTRRTPRGRRSRRGWPSSGSRSSGGSCPTSSGRSSRRSCRRPRPTRSS